MKSLFLGLSLALIGALGVSSAHADVQLGTTLPDVTKALSHLDTAGPNGIATVQSLIKDGCAAKRIPANACRFDEITRMQAQFLKDWNALLNPADEKVLPTIIVEGDATNEDWRAVLWNVKAQDRDAVAEQAAVLVARYFISLRAMQLTFEHAADWVQSIGNGPRGMFGETIRPVVSAWLSSTNPINRLAALSEGMSCGPSQFGCQAVKAKLAEVTLSGAANLQRSLGVLDHLEVNKTLNGMIMLDVEFEAIFKTDTGTIIDWLKTDQFANVPVIRTYINHVKAISLLRKDTGFGKWGLADQLKTVVVLLDLKRFSLHAAQMPKPAQVIVSPESEKQLQDVVSKITPQLLQYEDALGVIISRMPSS